MKNCCLAEYLENLIKNTSDGEICIIPKGEYYIERKIVIKNRKKLKICGSGSIIISHFNNGNSNVATSDIFYILNCSDVELYDFVFTTDYPVNLTGVVRSVNKADGSYEIEVLHKYHVTGKEIFMMQNSCDDENCFDGLSVPMVAEFINNRRIMAGWVQSPQGWGGVLLQRELVAEDNGKLGMRWVPELMPRLNSENLLKANNMLDKGF